MPMIFVEADEPLLVFPSIEAAESYLEAVDVRAGVYPRAYGELGEVYDITARDGLVVIQPSGASPTPNDLNRLLSRYLEAVGESVSGEAELPVLVAAVEAHETAFWLEHDPYGDRFSKPIPWWGCLVIALGVGGGCILSGII